MVYAQAQPVDAASSVHITVQSTGVTGPPAVQPLTAAYPSVQPLSAVALPSTQPSSEPVVYATAVPVQVVAASTQGSDQSVTLKNNKAAYVRKLAQQFVEKEHKAEEQQEQEQRHKQQLRDENLLVNEAEEVIFVCAGVWVFCVSEYVHVCTVLTHQRARGASTTLHMCLNVYVYIHTYIYIYIYIYTTHV
jgi:hypothetical protein